jgi:hypothetical protein
MLSWAERHLEFSTALTQAKVREQAWWEEFARKVVQGWLKGRFNSIVWKTAMRARFQHDYPIRGKRGVADAMSHEDYLELLR